MCSYKSGCEGRGGNFSVDMSLFVLLHAQTQIQWFSPLFPLREKVGQLSKRKRVLSWSIFIISLWCRTNWRHERYSSVCHKDGHCVQVWQNLKMIFQSTKHFWHNGTWENRILELFLDTFSLQVYKITKPVKLGRTILIAQSLTCDKFQKTNL